MDHIDQFASSLLDEAKRFMERAKEAQSGVAEGANLHAALMLAFCSLEAHVNAVADEFASRSDLSVHEKALLLEKDIQLVDGDFRITSKLRIWRMEDRIEFLHRRFSKAGELDSNAGWRSQLSGAVDLRNKLTHPKSIPVITVGAVEKAIQAVISTLDALYRAIYGRPFPATAMGLSSTLDF